MKDLNIRFAKTLGFLRESGFGSAGVGIILGTGASEAASIVTINSKALLSDAPGLPASLVGFQTPTLIYGRIGDVPVIVSDGRLHYYEGHAMADVAAIVYIMRAWRRRLYINSAVGGINSRYSTGELVLVKDHIYLCSDNPVRGLKDANGKQIFPNMLSAYGETGRAHIRRVAPEAGIVLKEGTLAYLPGPAFETRAELRYLASMGADLVGWSMAPEVMMAHALGMKTTGICCVSDISDPDAVTDADLDAIVGVCKASAVRLGKLLPCDREADSIAMRILFIINVQDLGFEEPLGALYLSAAAKKLGHEVFAVENVLSAVERKIEEIKPDLLAVSALTPSFPYLYKLLREVRRRLGIPTVVGGPHATYFPEIIAEEGIDYVFRGEGENSFIEFLDALSGPALWKAFAT